MHILTGSRSVRPSRARLRIAPLIASLVAIAALWGCTQAAAVPVATDTPVSTVTGATATPTVTATSPSPTSLVPTSSPTVNPGPTATPSPTPTTTPDHFGPNGIDQRFGIVTIDASRAWQLSEIQVDWYLDYSNTVTDIPEGKNKVLYLKMRADDPRLTAEEIRQRTEQYPGAVWYLGGEPNVPIGKRYMRITPDEYIAEFRYYRQYIKDADPTALITGPSILNWDFTCRDCGGYTSGEKWMREFVSKYEDIYGVPPQVDIWAIDSYPLTWDAVPMVEWAIVAEQIEGFRKYLVEEVPGHADTPIWVTELASHWAYEELAVKDWKAEYEWNAMEGYMINLLGWLRKNSDRLGVEKWFFFRAYVDVEKQAAADSYAGIYFFEGPEEGAALNQLGRAYRDMATGVR